MQALADPKHKISRQFKVLNHFQEHGWAFPVSCEIDLTWRCALNCKGCHSKWLHRDQELKPEEICRILRDLAIHGLKSVTWSGGGEPLESPYWKYAMEEAKAWKLDQGLYTYFPEPTQEKVDYVDDTLEWVYSHNFRTKGLKRREGTKNVWTAGWLLDKENWSKVYEFVHKTDLEFFNFVDFRPLIVDGADYSWVQRAIEFFEVYEHPQVRWAKYKMYDLLKPDRGRNYRTCFATNFTASVGPNGDVYECLNRRGFADSVIGNLVTEDIETIVKRKTHQRTDFTGCRILCRSHEMNKELSYLLGPEPQHASFV